MDTIRLRAPFLRAAAALAAALLLALAPPARAAAGVALPAGASGARIQQALDSLPAAGGEVLLARGTYEIASPIVLARDGQALCGAGSATILRLAPGADCPVILMGQPVDDPIRAVAHLRVSGLFIDGNRLAQDRETWRPGGDRAEIHNNGITVQDVRDSLVSDVTCAHCRSGGLVTTLGVRRLTVRNFEAFDNQFDGLACYETSESRFSHLYLHDNRCAGISLDLAFDRNTISDAVLSGNDLGIFMRASRGNLFESVSVRRSRHFGVFIAQADILTARGWRLVPHTECTDNTFLDYRATGCGGAAFRVNDLACTDNLVTGPTLAAAARVASPAPRARALLVRSRTARSAAKAPAPSLGVVLAVKAQ